MATGTEKFFPYGGSYAPISAQDIADLASGKSVKVDAGKHGIKAGSVQDALQDLASRVQALEGAKSEPKGK